MPIKRETKVAFTTRKRVAPTMQQADIAILPYAVSTLQKTLKIFKISFGKIIKYR